MQAFSSYGERGLLPSCREQTSPCGAFSCCGAQALDKGASVVGVHRLSCPEGREIFPDCGSNPACPCTARHILNPWTNQGSRRFTLDWFFWKRRKTDWGRMMSSFGRGVPASVHLGPLMRTMSWLA